jgi:hypothetical protein
MMPPKTVKYSDNYQTPDYAIEPLLPYLKQEQIIWDCACGNGNIVRYLNSKGFKAIGTDINMGFEYNFLFYQPERFDCIITNPPYSNKDMFIERCYMLGKPWAMLMPITALEGKRQRLFERYGIELLLLDKRIEFTDNTKTGAWFATAWFCWQILPKQIIFAKIKNKKN